MNRASQPLQQITASLVTAMYLTACVTTHVTDTAALKDQDLVVSCVPNPEVDSKHFALIVCTFENTGAKWLDAEVSSVSLKDGTVSSPADTQVFIESWAAKRSQDRYNSDMALAAVMLGGLVLAAASHGKASDAGLGLSMGAAAMSGGREVRDTYRAAQYGTLTYGRDHILGETLRVPPEAFVRRSVLFELGANAAPRKSELKICFKNPEACLSAPLSQAPIERQR